MERKNVARVDAIVNANPPVPGKKQRERQGCHPNADFKSISSVTTRKSMSKPNSESLRTAKCVPCEGGVPTIDSDAAAEYLPAIPNWSIELSGKAISRKIVCDHFVDAMTLLNQIAEIAEQQQHHPDLHLTGYRKVGIELTTHAIGGLSENDFIVAAKIDQLPRLRKSS